MRADHAEFIRLEAMRRRMAIASAIVHAAIERADPPTVLALLRDDAVAAINDYLDAIADYARVRELVLREFRLDPNDLN